MIGRHAARISLIFLAVALVLDTGAWFAATAALRRSLLAWQSAAAARGVTLAFAGTRRAGWPWAARLVVTRPVLRAASESWRVDRAVLSLTPVHLRSLGVAIQGAETLTGVGAVPVGVQPRSLRLAVPFDPGAGMTLRGADLAVRVPASAAAAAARIGRLEASFVAGDPGTARPGGPGGPGAAVRPARLAYTLQASAFSVGAVGRADDRLLLAGTIDTPALPDGALAAQARAWRAAGGRATASVVSLDWGPFAVHGDATLRLNAGLQPDLDARLHVSGYGEALAVLERAGALSHGQAVACRTALALLAGLRPDLTLEVGIAGGEVSVGGLPVARVAALRWPGDDARAAPNP